MPSKPSAKPSRKTPARSHTVPTPADPGDLAALRERLHAEDQQLGQQLSAAASAHHSVQQTLGQLAALEHRLALARERDETAAAEERAALGQHIAELEGQAHAAAAELERAADNTRGLIQALVGAGDPLEPRVDGDDPSPLQRAGTGLAKIASLKRGPLAELAGLADTMDACRELAELVAARVRTQSHRVGLLRNHVLELERDAAEALRHDEEQAGAIAGLQQDLERRASELETARARIAAIEHELAEQRDSAARERAAAAKAAAEAAAVQQDLDERLADERRRAEQLAADLRGRGERARRAETLAVEVADVLVTLADTDLDEEPCPMPTLRPLRDELQGLVSDAGEAVDEDDDELFAGELTEDLLAAARAVAEAIGKRRQAVIDALGDLQQQADDVEVSRDATAADLAEREQELLALTHELDKSSAQLASAIAELEELRRELGASSRELTEARSRIADLEAKIAALAVEAERGQETAAELRVTRDELAGAQKELSGAKTRADDVLGAHGLLTRALSGLGDAVDAACLAAGLKSGPGRISKSLQRLEGLRSGDQGALVRSAAELVDKLAHRLDQIATILRERDESVTVARRSLQEIEQRLGGTDVKLAKREEELKAMRLEVAELGKAAKRLPQLEEKLAAREQALAKAKSEGEEVRQQLRQLRAETSDLQASASENANSLEGEVKELRRRLSAAEQARLAAEQGLGGERDDLEAQLSTLRAQADQYLKTLEAREEALAEARAELDAAAELAGRLRESEARERHMSDELDAAAKRVRELELALEERQAAAALEEEVAVAQRQRDELQAKLRGLERELAEERGLSASLRSGGDNLKKKLSEVQQRLRGENDDLVRRNDELLEENRRMKEKLAGLNARVRTLTDS